MSAGWTSWGDSKWVLLAQHPVEGIPVIPVLFFPLSLSIGGGKVMKWGEHRPGNQAYQSLKLGLAPFYFTEVI